LGCRPNFAALNPGTSSEGGAICASALRELELPDGVDLGKDRVRADLLGVSRHHRINQLLHLRAVGESNALELAGFLERVELGAVFRGLDLPAVAAGFFTRLDDGGLQLGREFPEGLAREAASIDRPATSRA
jgi:hypothetical protein